MSGMIESTQKEFDKNFTNRASTKIPLKVDQYLGQVLGYSSPPVRIWNLGVLKVHRLLPNVLIQKYCAVVRS